MFLCAASAAQKVSVNVLGSSTIVWHKRHSNDKSVERDGTTAALRDLFPAAVSSKFSALHQTRKNNNYVCDHHEESFACTTTAAKIWAAMRAPRCTNFKCSWYPLQHDRRRNPRMRILRKKLFFPPSNCWWICRPKFSNFSKFKITFLFIWNLSHAGFIPGEEVAFSEPSCKILWQLWG